jgi:hypothetical protein
MLGRSGGSTRNVEHHVNKEYRLSDAVEWTCTECGTAIADGTGGLFVTPGTAGEPTASWHSRHDDCRPTVAPNDHRVGIEDLRNEVEVIHATAHLMEEGWLPSTNWHQILLNITDRKGNPVSS